MTEPTKATPPTGREVTARITAARCPACHFYAAIAFPSKGPDWLFCGRCSETWRLA